MDLDLVTLAPLIAGGILLLAFIFNLLRDPKFSGGNALVLALGSLLIIIPMLTNFTFKGSGFEITGQIRAQIGEQGADLKREIADLRKELDTVRAGGPPTGTAATGPAAPPRPRAPSVLIFYTAEQKALAVKIEVYLLQNGYAANAIYTDFGEMDSKEVPGTVRFVFTPASQTLAASLKSTLQSQFPEILKVADRYRDRLNSGDVQLQLF